MPFAAMDLPFPSRRNASLQAQQMVTAEMDPMASDSSAHRETRKQHPFHMNLDVNGTSWDSQHDLSPRSGVNPSNSQIKVLCSFGGRIMVRPGDGKLRYHGGETRIVALDRNLSYKEFILKMADIYCAYIMLKYQLPGEDLDALVSIASDEDFQNLLDEYDKLESNGSVQRLRIFLFDDPSQCEILDSCISSEDIENHSPEVKYYVDTLNGIQDKMFDMHLERGIDALSPRYTHRKGRTKSDRLYSTNPFVNPFVKAASSAPSSPSFSLRKPYPNPWGIMDTPFQALEEWKNVIPSEATRDIFVDTSSTSKCNQNQGCGQSPQLHQGMGFSRGGINSNAKDAKMHVTRQCEHHYEPTIVAGTWNDVKHAAGRTSIQVQSVNQLPNQRLYEIQDHHPEVHKQMNLARQPDLEGSQFQCRECSAPLQWSPEYDHKISMIPQVRKSHLQSTMSVRVVPSSSQEVCVRCNRAQQHTQVHNACVAEHTQNRSCGDQSIKSHGPLSLSSGLHDGSNDLLDDCSWQQQPNPVKWLGVEEQNNTMLEERNAHSCQHEYSLRGHPPENADNVLSKNLLSHHEPHPDHCQESQDRLEHFTDQNKSMDVDAENPFGTEKPSGSFSLQVRPCDVELQNTWTNISHSKDPTMMYNYQRDCLDRSVYEGVLFTLDDSSNVGCGRSGFASESASFSSINDEAAMSSSILLTQDLFDTLASAGENQDLLERNADGIFSQKESLTETSHTPVSNIFCLSAPVNDDNDHEEIVDFESYSATAKPINFSQDTDENIIRHLDVPSVAFRAPNFGRSCSSLGASTSDCDLNKEGSPDSIKCQQMRSLSWQSGARGWTNQEEALITLASPIFDESPVSSLNIENPSLKNSEESFFVDSVNWFKENICFKGEDGNERVSSVMNVRPCERISERKDDDIERHCNRIFEKDAGRSSQHLSRESTEEKEANANIWEDSTRPYQFSGRASPEGKERDSGSFCFQQLKKKSSVIEAEAEATARGLQIIKNEDLEELRVLGSGTYGTVFHGKWRGSDVAIKRIKFSCLEGCRPSVQERLVSDFWREAGTLGQLHHPNIVAFYGVVPDGPDGNLATVTEFMVNGSLKQVLLKKDRTIDRKKRLLIAMDAAFGMEYLHSKNVVHFDLKSENLLVNMRDAHRPICKVGDFGLSKVKQHTLVSGGIRGTLPWMAPELLSEKHIMVTEKIDVYSFGIVMWELLTGEEPYANLHCGAIVGGIVNNTLRPSIPSSCDPNWRQLMEKCWAADPADRPSFAEISRELRSMAASMNIK